MSEPVLLMVVWDDEAGTMWSLWDEGQGHVAEVAYQ